MKFYTPLGTELTKKEFIEYYSEAYYTGKVNEETLKSIHKNSSLVEYEIERILEDGIETELDVVHILAWKTGKLRLNAASKSQPFVYHKDWNVNEETQEYCLKRYGRDFPVQNFVKYIVENIDDLQNLHPQELLDSLNRESIDNIGTVYLITLLYFISKAKYPIYDKFAWLALQAIKREENPANNTGIKYKELPSKDSVGFYSLCENEYADYICDLERIFGKEYQTNRNIDRALWVYGHMYQYNKSNC